MDYSKINKLNLLGTIINADESGVLAEASQIYDSTAKKSIQGRVDDIDKTIKTIQDSLSSALHFVGWVAPNDDTITDDATTNPVKLVTASVVTTSGTTYTTVNHTPSKGDVIVKGNKEFVWVEITSNGLTTSHWEEFGDLSALSGLGTLSKQNSASGSYTPAGTVASTFKGTAATISTSSKGTLAPTAKVDVYEAGASTSDIGLTENAVGQDTLFTPKAKASGAAATFTGTKATITSTGSVSSLTSSTMFLAAGTPGQEISNLEGANETGHKAFAGVTPKATATGGNAVFKATTTSIQQITGVGTLPTLTTNVSGETLTIGFSQGSLPTRAAVTVATGGSNTITQPTISVGPIIASLDDVKANVSATASYTPAGTIAVTQPTVTVGPMVLAMSTMNVAVSGSTSYTPAGSVTSAFTGTAATITVK